MTDVATAEFSVSTFLDLFACFIDTADSPSEIFQRSY